MHEMFLITIPFKEYELSFIIMCAVVGMMFADTANENTSTILLPK